MNQNQTKSQSTITQPDVPSSPISEMLHAIEAALSSAHEEFSMLDNKVTSIRAPAPESVAGGVDPAELMPTQMENQLRNIYDTVRYLTRRIETTRNELRI